MNEPAKSAPGAHRPAVAPLLARWLLGGLFLYLGLYKAFHPVDFLKLVRQYDIVESPVLVNSIAACLPWLEVFTGLLLVSGIAVRGAALMSLGMLVPLTAAVLHRALGIHAVSSIPFCAVRFDCGCGTGEVVICYKLVENGLLILLSVLLLKDCCPRWCLRYYLVKPAPR
jgi:uncharacterized membrane protein YphA (DoxX/SURF4 family)